MIKFHLKNRVKNLEATCSVSGLSGRYLPRDDADFIDKEHLDIVREVKDKFFLDVDSPLPTFETYRAEMLKTLERKGYKMKEQTLKDDYQSLCDIHDYFNGGDMNILSKVFAR